MREMRARIGETTILLHPLLEQSGGRVDRDQYDEPVEFRGSLQPLGDTGRRQDRFDEHLRLGSIEGWRLFVRREAADEAGLSFPWCKRGDIVSRKSMPEQRFSCRGEPISQAWGDDDSPVLWSVDLDGVT